MVQKIKGQELHIWVGEGENAESIALSTNTTIEITANTESLSTKTKDEVGGEVSWEEAAVSSLAWSASSDNVLTLDTDNGANYESLYDKMILAQPIQICFGKKNSTALNSDSKKGWTPNAFKFVGNALITSLNLTGSVSDYATFSVSLTGVGKLEKTN